MSQSICFGAPSGWLAVPLSWHIWIRGAPHAVLTSMSPAATWIEWIIQQHLLDGNRKNGNTYTWRNTVKILWSGSAFFLGINQKPRRVKWVKHLNRIKDENPNKIGEKGWGEVFLGKKLAKRDSLEPWESKLPCVPWSDCTYWTRTWCADYFFKDTSNPAISFS